MRVEGVERRSPVLVAPFAALNPKVVRVGMIEDGSAKAGFRARTKSSGELGRVRAKGSSRNPSTGNALLESEDGCYFLEHRIHSMENAKRISSCFQCRA